MDEKNGYCGFCHWWTSDPVLGQVTPFVDRLEAYHVTGSGLDKIGLHRAAARRRLEGASRLFKARPSWWLGIVLLRCRCKLWWAQMRYRA